MPPRAKTKGRKALTAKQDPKLADEVTVATEKSAKARGKTARTVKPAQKAKTVSKNKRGAKTTATGGTAMSSVRRRKGTKKTEEEVGEEEATAVTTEDAPTAKRRKTSESSPVEDTLRQRANEEEEEEEKRPSAKRKVEEAIKLPPVSHPSHLTTAGEVMMIGQGDVGQLGLGEDIMERKKPSPVGGVLSGRPVVQTVCGGMHTAALTADGKVFTWGCNDEGALGWSVEEEGREYEPGEVVEGGLEGVRVVQVCAGDSHTAALASTGEVHCWGVFRDSNGPIGLVASELPSPTPVLVYSSPTNRAIKIASGSSHVVLLTEQGDVLTFGCGEQGQLGRVPECFSSRGGRKGVQFFLKPQFVRFRKLRGHPVPKFSDVFCGAYHTFAVTRDKAVYAWGLNNYGQLGTADVESRYQPERLPPDWLTGDVENDQPDSSVPDQIEIAGGQHHSIACRNGKLYAMGRKEYGRLGLGEDCEEPAGPMQIAGVEGVKTVAGGTACSFAVTDGGEGYAWGMGTSLQLGTGTEDDRWTPEKMTGKKMDGRKVLLSSAGGQHTALLVTAQE